MDLSALTIGELKDLQLQVSMELSEAEKKVRDSAMEQIYQIANSLNMPLNMGVLKDQVQHLSCKVPPWRESTNI